MSNLASVQKSMLRLTGMSSGLNTESLVTSLLKVDQTKVDKQYRVKTKLEWTGDAYRDINLKLRNFREKYMSVSNPAENVFSAGAYKTFNVNMQTETSAVSISANSKAMAGSMRIDSIRQLASAASVESRNITNGNPVKLNTKLSELADPASEDAFFAVPLQMAVDDSDPENIVQTLSFTINDVNFTFDGEASLSDVMNRVNASTAGVTMSYSSLRGGFMITTKTTGADSTIKIENGGGNAFGAGGAFGIEEYVDAPGAGQRAIAAGQNAIMVIDGIEVQRASNGFTIDGVTYTLKETFNVAGAPDQSIGFTVERDVETTLSKLKNFVAGYNALIKDLNDRVNEPIYRSYTPLTSDEKSALSESDAKEWDGLAKSGLLRNDANVSGLLSQLRGAFYNVVEGAGKAASDIGLSTSVDYLSGGQIVLNEDAMRAALQENPERVAQIFTGISKAEDASQRYRESGVVVRISDAMIASTKSINEVALASNKSAIRRADDQLTKLEEWLASNEEKYWTRFTAMEKALSSLNSQSNWFSSMLGTSSSSS